MIHVFLEEYVLFSPLFMGIISWNVQGLDGSCCRRLKNPLRQELQKCLIGGSLDVLMIQEHRLNQRRIGKYGSFFPGN